MPPSLPTLEECTTTLTPIISNPDPGALTPWRQIVHQCLASACDETSGVSVDNAAQLLGDALKWYAGNRSSCSAPDNEDAVICTVVESVWLMDCLLDDANTLKLVELVKSLMRRAVKDDDEADNEADESNKSPTPLIPPSLLQTTLEFPLLKSINLLPPATPAIEKAAKAAASKTKSTPDAIIFGTKQKYMKVNANMYYRQHKFNLFVEESEGYAKLITYLVGSRGGNNNGSGSNQDVKSLIGAFDIDPNRALDVAIDALEWELKCLVDAINKEEVWKLSNVKAALRNETKTNSLLSIIRELDGHTPRAVVHLLGFKFRYYARGKEKSTSKSSNSQYPQSLLLATAYLAASNIVDIHNLLPHLLETNNHDLMTQYQKYCTDTAARLKKMGVISLNAKTTNDEETKKSDEVDSDPFTNDAVIGIFRYMLMVGEWDDAAGFLAHATVSEFKAVVSSGDCTKLEKIMSLAVLAACSLSDCVAVAISEWVSCVVDDVKKESTDGMLVHKNSALCDVSNVLLEPLLCLVGSGKIRLNEQLYKKLCSLYQTKLAGLKKNDSKEVDASNIDAETMALLSKFLVPSLSIFPSNPELSHELWSVLQLLPHPIRYKLYSSWRSPALEKGVLRNMLPKDIKAGVFPKPLNCIESEIKTSIQAKSIMKRISKENIEDKMIEDKQTRKMVREMGKGRELSESSHNNPLVVFSYILNQIESYDNMILLMVDAFQYVTPLGLDVIGYCLLLSLGGDDDSKRSRTKSSGLNTEQWLTSLETFTGAFYKRFPDVELRGLLSYIAQRLQDGEASELGVLRSLIKTAGGYGFVDYDSTSSLSELQLEGRCGSRLLKLETSSFGVIDNVNPKASRMLRSVLQGEDLGVIILLLLSQIRQKVLYAKSKSEEHIKVMGRLYDECESVFCLLLEYISDSSDDLPEGPNTKEMFAISLPPLASLCETYKLDTATAWMLIRPLFRKSLFFQDDKKLAGKSSSGEPPEFLKPFSPTPEMTTSYQKLKLLPEPAWKYISAELFEMFYSLSIYDIQCPSERYSLEINRLNREVERLSRIQQGKGVSAMTAAAAAAGGSASQIRDASKFTDEHKREQDRLKHNVDKLNTDFSRQQKRCELVLAKLEAQKHTLIKTGNTADGLIEEGLASAFLTFCLYPRFLCSPEDALFCAHFVKLMHKMKVPGFSTIELIDGVVNAITGSLYAITEDEAGNAAIFLNELWKSTNLWRYDNDSFASELKDMPGSRLSKAYSQEKNIGDHSMTDGITHDDYKMIFSQWHLKIGSAAVGCLNSSEYIHTRCALIVLSRIVLVYPTQPKVGDKLLDILATLQADESRPDIRATAQGYASQLSKARDEGMWKEENIAVTKARQEKELMKLEERKKKLAEQDEAMRKETEKINREIGDGRDYNRRGGGRDDVRGRPWSGNQGPPLNTAAPVFIPRGGAPPRELHSGPPRRDGHDHGRDRRDDAWERDRGVVHGPNRHHDSDRYDNRRHGDDSSPRRKRSHSPEPGEDTGREKRFKSAARGSDRASRPERRTRSGRN